MVTRCHFIFSMERNTVFNYFKGRTGEVGILWNVFLRKIVNLFNCNEFIDRGDRNTELIFKRIDFVCVAECLKIAVVRETRYKQLQRYFKYYFGMGDT